MIPKEFYVILKYLNERFNDIFWDIANWRKIIKKSDGVRNE